MVVTVDVLVEIVVVIVTVDVLVGVVVVEVAVDVLVGEVAAVVDGIVGVDSDGDVELCK